MSLTDVFPVEPVIPTSGQPSSRRQARASACNAASGSRTANTQPGAAGRRARRPAPGSTTTPHAPAVERRGGVLATVRALAAQPEEEVARAGVARIDRRASGRPRSPSRTISVPAAAASLSGASSITRAPPAERAQLLPATSRSSNGILRPCSNSCPCSCPLPAITTVSPGPRRAARARSRRAGRARPRPRRRAGADPLSRSRR